MASSGSGSALPEHWTELNAARKNRQLCAEDVAAIKKSCETADEGGVKHVAESPSHFSQALDRMLARYKDSSDREWFSERGAVLFGLDNMFAEAKEWKTSLKDIDASIGSEKEAWYRWVLRKYPEFLCVADSGVDQDEVRRILDDPDRSGEELVAMVSRAVGMPEDWSSRLDAFAEKVAAGDAAAVKKLYIEEFFKDRSTGETLEHAQKYLDMYESDPDMRLEDIIDKIISANREDRSSQAQRETKQQHLNQLQRARTAFEQNKARNKSLQLGAQTNKVHERYYSLPPCAVCGKNVDPSGVISCPLCHMVVHMGGEAGMTVYCSDECHDKGYDEHMDQEHSCVAEDKCVQETDEDDTMEDEPADAMACNECLDQKQVTLFCSGGCAERNLPAHRKSKHGLETEAGSVRDLVSPVSQMVGVTLTEESTGLKFQG